MWPVRMAPTVFALASLFCLLAIHPIRADTPPASPSPANAAAVGFLEARLAMAREVLPAAGCLEIPFAEQRSFPFRRNVRRLEGRLLRDLDNDRFVFVYERPRPFRILYATGMAHLVRRGRGPEALPEAAAGMALFGALFNAIDAAFKADWEVAVAADVAGGETVFRLTPKSTQADGMYAGVELRFSGEALRGVVVARDNGVGHHYIFGEPLAMDCAELAAAFE